MIYVILLLLLCALLYGPQLWARSILKRYSGEDNRFPGTGGEFARHLLDGYDLADVRVEPTPLGDHYDPGARTVRLSAGNFNGKSLTAVVTAAHEVGHALQDFKDYRPLGWRGRLALAARPAERIGSVAVLAMAVVAAAPRAPGIGILFGFAGLGTLALPAVVHLITLPVEWHASFRLALPILERGRYLDQQQMPAARRILTACALTYLASSLASLLNLWRWLRIVLRR
jgi:Zn-dependent membrane protease YugP